MQDYGIIKAKAEEYKNLRGAVHTHRKAWEDGLKKTIIDELESIIKATELSADVEVQEDVANLEAIIMNMGVEESGIYERVSDIHKKQIFRSNGMLIYQQLFNGKVMVIITYPFIEGVVNPKPPKNLEILRPEELTVGFISRHVETFLKDMNDWEDYDDDEPQQKIGFNAGFQKTQLIKSSEDQGA